MHRVVMNVQTNEIQIVPLTPYEMAEHVKREDSERDQKTKQIDEQIKQQEYSALLKKIAASHPDAPEWLKNENSR